jgi:hypothetical protein
VGIHLGKRTAAPAATGGEDEETDEEFEARVYEALVGVLRSSSERVRSALSSCVLLGTPYEGAPDLVRQTVRDFISQAEL